MLEPNGRISFLMKSDARPAEPKDFSISPEKASISPTVILDGETLHENLKAAGYDGFCVNTTGFADDSEIPESCRGEVAAAEAIGVVRGVERDGQLFFCPNNRITRAEAAVMLQRLTGSSSSDAQIAVFSDESVPAWARGAMSALAADGSSFAPYREVTRAEAAQLASAVILRRAG